MQSQELLCHCQKVAQQWLDSPFYDEEDKLKVAQLLLPQHEEELIDAFYQSLAFGTGGLRGIMGVGSNRMNKYVVAQATQGFANYLRKCYGTDDQISVVVGYDNRHNSRLFAETAATVFAANDIRVYLFDEMRPTPEVSFAIRHLGCQGGVNITASHNPREYNGYKAYWSDGAQVLVPHDREIMNSVAQVTLEAVCREAKPERIVQIGKDVDDAYLQQIKQLSLLPTVCRAPHPLRIVYTPLHGTGMHLVPRCLREFGFEEVECVAAQMTPDGDFPTVQSPNPDNVETLALALEQARRSDADLLLASDPDADRLSAACRDERGEWVLLDGHQTCMLLFHYLLEMHRFRKDNPTHAFLIKTIVTTDIVRAMAEDYGVAVEETYIGFKWIAQVLREREGKGIFWGGAEESYGFLAEDFARDKDAVSAAVLMAEAALWAKSQGCTLYQQMMALYVKYGYTETALVSLHKPGQAGAQEIRAMMAHFREQPPTSIADAPIVCLRDYQNLRQYDAEGQVTPLNMPASSNIIQWLAADGTKVSLRPSGTEPKIRFYIEVKSQMDTPEDYFFARRSALEHIDCIKREWGL